MQQTPGQSSGSLYLPAPALSCGRLFSVPAQPFLLPGTHSFDRHVEISGKNRCDKERGTVPAASVLSEQTNPLQVWKYTGCLGYFLRENSRTKTRKDSDYRGCRGRNRKNPCHCRVSLRGRILFWNIWMKEDYIY